MGKFLVPWHILFVPTCTLVFVYNLLSLKCYNLVCLYDIWIRQVVIKCFPWWNILLYNISNNNDYFHESFQRWRVALLILTALVYTRVPLKPTTTAGVPVMRWWSGESFRKSRQCCPVYHPQQRPHRSTRLCTNFLVSFCQFSIFLVL